MAMSVLAFHFCKMILRIRSSNFVLAIRFWHFHFCEINSENSFLKFRAGNFVPALPFCKLVSKFCSSTFGSGT